MIRKAILASAFLLVWVRVHAAFPVIPYIPSTSTYQGTNSVINIATVRTRNSPWTDVISSGAVGDCVTDDWNAIQSAINYRQSLSTSNAGTVLFPSPPGGCYISSQDLVISSNTNGLHLLGLSKYISIHFTKAGGNGIRFLGQHDNFIVENLDLYSTVNSTGTAIVSTNTTSSGPLRDFEIRDVNFEYFANGINIWGQLNGKIIGGRQGGLGKNSGNGYSGIQLGNDINNAGNGTHIENVYVSNFDYGLNALYDEPVNLVGLNLFGGCSTGVYVGPTSILYEAGEINFDSYNDVALRNDGYVFYAGALSSVGAQKTTSSNHRLFYLGHTLSRIEAYLSTSPVVGNNTWTLAQFNATNENTENYFSTITYLYTAPYPGYRMIDAVIRWDINVSTAEYQIGISTFTGATAPAKQVTVYGPAAPLPATKVISTSIHDLMWLDTGNVIGIMAFQNEGSTVAIHGGSLNSWLTISDP